MSGSTSRAHEEDLGAGVMVNAGENLPVLDPDGLWFTHDSIKSIVKNSIQVGFKNKFYNTWKKADKDQQNQWWYAFRGQVSFDSRHETMIREAYEKYASRRFADWIYRAKADPESRHWMNPDILRGFNEWIASPEFQTKSQKKKESRASGSTEEDGKIPGTHAMGRRGFNKYVSDLDNNREAPLSVIDVVTSSKKKKSGNFVSKKFQKILDNFTSKKDKMLETQPDTPVDETRLYYEAAGGYDKKGRVYGMGSGASMYFERPAAPRHSSAETYSPGIVTRLSQQMARDNEAQAKLRQEFEEYKKSQDEKTAWMEQILREKLGIIPPASCNPGSSQHRDDRSDHGPGGSDMGLGSTPRLTG